jgi:hypothetical protein
MNQSRTGGLAALFLLVAFTGGLLWALPGDTPPEHSTSLYRRPSQLDEQTRRILREIEDLHTTHIPMAERLQRWDELIEQLNFHQTALDRTLQDGGSPCPRVSPYTFDRACAER